MMGIRRWTQASVHTLLLKVQQAILSNAYAVQSTMEAERMADLALPV